MKNDTQYKDGKLILSPEFSNQLEMRFPANYIKSELNLMEVWLLTNPPKKKWDRFITNWLIRNSGKVKPEPVKPVNMAEVIRNAR